MDLNDHRDLTRVANLKLVLQNLFNHREISRADIANKTGLHKSTVSSLFQELDQEGFVTHLGRGSSTKTGGRKPELYKFNEKYGYVACFNITYYHLYVMFLRLDGEEFFYDRIRLANHDILNVMSLISRYLDQDVPNNDTENGLLGISFSIHSVVDHNKITYSPYFNLNGIDLQDYYTNRYKVPVLIGNEANLAAIFERDYAHHHSADNFIVLSIHRGPGIGVIANHDLFTGHTGRVGEVGGVVTLNHHGELQELGDYFSVDYLVRKINHVLGENLTYNEIEQLCHDHDPRLNGVINDFAKRTGTLIFNLAMLYGPAEIYINSPLIEVMPSLIQQVQSYANQKNLHIAVRAVKGSKYVSLFGAGALIIRHVLGLTDDDLHFKWSHHVE